MVRYYYITITVGICRDFDEDVHIDVIDFNNPVKTLCNLIEHGDPIVELKAVLGKSGVDNYMYPIKRNGEIKYRSCFVIRKYYLKLPRPMTKDEAMKYIEEITGIKTPIKASSNKENDFLIRLYEKLGRV